MSHCRVTFDKIDDREKAGEESGYRWQDYYLMTKLKKNRG
jgi:hypothetical protein